MSIKSAQEDIMRMYRNGRTPSTATELIPAVGTLVSVRFESVTVACRVLDAKKSWDKVRLEVTPLQGSGSQWVELPRIAGRLDVDSGACPGCGSVSPSHNPFNCEIPPQGRR
jgi:hypothetical protein